ncbi:carbamoyltransferase [Bradyrhizobium sp. ORS 111]|uniref:carbamoyltransferase family protein n=1 Tax=Bradyrhizobium sp. ORS 111 TaxID=1685958 RepID=UPI00388F6F0D
MKTIPKPSTIILGINAHHADSSACLVRDGHVVAAAEEERFRRIKHWAGFPSEAIRYCLGEAKVSLSEIDYVAVNQNSRDNLIRKIVYLLARRPSVSLVLSKLRNRRSRAGVEMLLRRMSLAGSFRGEVVYVEHHEAHLSSAFHMSPFEEGVAVSVDGFGDFASAAWGSGRNTTLSIDGRVYFPHSLGVFYQAITQHLGFPHYGDEYKVMGLAPYGKPRYLDTMRQIVRTKKDGTYTLDLSFFRHHRDEVTLQWTDGPPIPGEMFSPKLETLLGPRRRCDEPLVDRHSDIASSVQAMYEEAFFHLLNMLHARYRISNLALAGGCAMNSVANGKIRQFTPFRRVYVQAAAGDAGGAIGAAFVQWHRLGGGRDFVMNHAYLGPQYSAPEIARLLDERRGEIDAAGCAVENIHDEKELCSRVAKVVAEGKVIGWFQGRMEWGPRALGNRSIICDPRRADMKTILNAKIKRRESFRPFAPSILADAVSEWFEDDDAVPFMMQVFQVRKEKRLLIPAVTHVDGSGRLQTVSREANPRYYALIEAFRDISGIPIVLNTSFNENEPIVCRPDEALDCFLRTKMDVLVLGTTYIQR